MKEIACQFGENKRLHGVLTVPREARRPNLALVLVSAGFTAKSGPYRLYTDIARALAELGFMTLRFDLGGIGNSQIARPDQPLQERTKQDIRDALTYLETNREINDFVIGGLCSGAEDAFRYAETDERTQGVILVDPHAYRNFAWRVRGILTRYSFNRIVYKVLRTTKVINVVVDTQDNSNVEGFEGSLIDYQYMAQKESTRILSTLVDRGTHVHYIYTAGRIDTFHHKSQIYSMFPTVDFKDRLAIDHLPHIQHVQIFAEDRRILVDAIVRRFASLH
ncbi:MAG: serine aminopeptidase domain-containing protein [Woeseiaceae bacterium]